MHTMKSGKTCGRPDGHNGQCKSVEAVRRRYEARLSSPQRREYIREYYRRLLATPEGRAAAREASRRARSTPDGRAAARAATRRTNLKTGYAAGRRRRARQAGITEEQVSTEALWERDGQVCYLCGCELELADVHREHMIPVASPFKGFRRLRAACADCNAGKGKRPLVVYLLERRAAGKPIRAEYQQCLHGCPLFESLRSDGSE